jgi:hypothetical protein
MKNAETKSPSTFSWLAYGALSLSMLMIAAVTATVGQDEVQTGGMGMEENPQFEMRWRMGMGFEKTEIKNDRHEIDRYLRRRIITTLHPEQMSRRAMPAPKYQYAIKLHVEEGRPIDNLVRFEVTKADSPQFESYAGMGGRRIEDSSVASTVVGAGILQIDSGVIFMETDKDNELVTLERLGRDHFASMIAVEIDQSAEKYAVASQ